MRGDRRIAHGASSARQSASNGVAPFNPVPTISRSIGDAIGGAGGQSRKSHNADFASGGKPDRAIFSKKVQTAKKPDRAMV
jgi:hypothetical protein